MTFNESVVFAWSQIYIDKQLQTKYIYIYIYIYFTQYIYIYIYIYIYAQIHLRFLYICIGLTRMEIKTEIWISFSRFKWNVCFLPQQKWSAIVLLSSWSLELFERPVYIYIYIYIYIQMYMYKYTCENN